MNSATTCFLWMATVLASFPSCAEKAQDGGLEVIDLLNSDCHWNLDPDTPFERQWVERVLLRDQQSFEQTHRALYSSTTPPPVPQIDFTQYSVVAARRVGMGCGDTVSVSDVREGVDAVEVELTTYWSCAGLPAYNAPYTFARIPHIDKHHFFSEKVVWADACPERE